MSRLFKSADTCLFNLNDSKAHPEFYETHFKYSEYEVLRDNNLIDDISRKYHDFDKNELLKNDFTLYYKNFAMWKGECAKDYSTEQIYESGKVFSSINQ